MRLGRLATSLTSSGLVTFTACTDLVTGPASGPRFENGRDDAITETLVAPPGFADMIRIGVIAAIIGSTPTTSLTLGSPTTFTVVNKVTGAELAAGTNENLTAVVIPGGTSQTRLWWQVACTGSVATRDNWTALVTTRGFEWYTEFVPAANCWRLRIGSLPTSASTAQRNAFRDSFIAAGLSFPPTAPGGPFTVTRSEGVSFIELRRGSTALARVPNEVVLSSPDGIVRIGARLYRGTAEVRIAAAAARSRASTSSRSRSISGASFHASSAQSHFQSSRPSRRRRSPPEPTPSRTSTSGSPMATTCSPPQPTRCMADTRTSIPYRRAPSTKRKA
jgi:hypothetical protein